MSFFSLALFRVLTKQYSENMKKNKVALNLRGLGIPAKLQKTRAVAKSLTGNPDYPNPIPTPEELVAIANKTESTFLKYQSLVQETASVRAILQEEDTLVDTVLTRVGGYVQVASGGDEAKIRSVGFDIKSDSSRISVVGIPLALAASAGQKPGTVALKWKPVRGAHAYVVQVTETIGDAESWKPAAVVTKSKALIEGLKTGTHYWFQVAVTAAVGQGAWSDPATRMAP